MSRSSDGAEVCAWRQKSVGTSRSGVDLSMVSFTKPPAPLPFFVCRRQNWSADCLLMQATQPAGTSIYLAFGGGDLVPFRLDAALHRRQPPARLSVRSSPTPSRIATTTRRRPSPSATCRMSSACPPSTATPQFYNFSINATAGTADLQTSAVQPLQFPTDIYIVGQASATQTSVTDLDGGAAERHRRLS